MGTLVTVAVWLVVIAVVMGLLSLVGALAGLVFKVLPFLLVAVAVVFFVKGGKVHIELPSDWKK